MFGGLTLREYNETDHAYRTNHVLNSSFERYFMGFIWQPRCPLCDETDVLLPYGCKTCGIEVEPVLVIDSSPLSIRLLLCRGQLTSEQLTTFLEASQIDIASYCPACNSEFYIKRDESGTPRPFCRGIFLPVMLNDEGKIRYSYRPVDLAPEKDEIAVMTESAYSSKLEKFRANVTDAVSSDTEPVVLPETELVEEPSRQPDKKSTFGNPTYKNVRNNILEYLSEKDSPASTPELVSVTGASKTSVNNNVNKMIESGELVRVRRGVYGLPKA